MEGKVEEISKLRAQRGRSAAVRFEGGCTLGLIGLWVEYRSLCKGTPIMISYSTLYVVQLK